MGLNVTIFISLGGRLGKKGKWKYFTHLDEQGNLRLVKSQVPKAAL